MARDWAGRPNGKKRPERDEYNCSRYDLGNQHYDKYCTTHLIRTAVVNQLLLEAIKEVCDYALNNETAFMEQVCSASSERQTKAAKAIRQRKQRSEKRTDELSRLIRKLYEDNVNGKLSDKLFEQMLHDFEAELESLIYGYLSNRRQADPSFSDNAGQALPEQCFRLSECLVSGLNPPAQMVQFPKTIGRKPVSWQVACENFRLCFVLKRNRIASLPIMVRSIACASS